MIWLWLACSTVDPGGRPTPVVDDETITAHDTGGPSLPDIDSDWVEPSLTPSQVAEQLTQALTDLPDPEEAIATYLALMTQGDDTCPGSEHIITDTWLYGCDATTGYSYAGVSDWLEGTFEQGGQVLELNGVAGDFRIDHPDGHRLDVGGHAVALSNPNMWIGELVGSWQFGQGSPWLVHGYSGHLVVEVIADTMSRVRGAINVNGTHLAARDLVLVAGCGYGPVGGLSLRDANGGWYRMDFTECNNCATVQFEGTDIGEACVDFEPLVATLGAHL